jgi:hypothetical protein
VRFSTRERAANELLPFCYPTRDNRGWGKFYGPEVGLSYCGTPRAVATRFCASYRCCPYVPIELERPRSAILAAPRSVPSARRTSAAERSVAAKLASLHLISERLLQPFANALRLHRKVRRVRRKGPAQPSPTLGDALNAGYRYLEVRCLGCATHQTVALDIVRRLKATPVHELERYMRCRQCSEVRRYAYKRSHLVALRATKISANDPPSTWWPGER